MGEDNASNGTITLVIPLTVLLLVLGSLAALKRWRNAADPPLPPGPRGLPILGYLPFLGEQLRHEFAKLAETYGPIYKLRLGNKLWVVLTSPSLVKEISRDQDVVFANRDATVAASTISYGGKDIAFAEYGPYWRRLRKVLVREMMSSSSLDACYSLRREEVRKSISSLYSKAGSPVEIGQLSLLVLVNATMAMLWGHSVKRETREDLSLEFRKVAAELMVLLGKPNVSDFFPRLAMFDIQGVARETRRVRKWIDAFLDSVIESATHGKANEGTGKADEAGEYEKKKDMLKLFIDHQMEQDNAISTAMTKNQELKAILSDIVLGGTDTASTMVEWAMAELLQNKTVLERVMEELTEVVGINHRVEEFHLPKLTYLDAVVKETFRLHPTLPLLVPRCPSQSVTLGGYTIPKGTKVFVNIWAIQRDPQLWETPLQFKPERFLKNPEIDFSGNNFTYLPFGSGRRVCPGLPLGEKMLKFVLSSFLHSFDWELPDGTELELSDKFGLVVKKMKPLVAIPRPRLSKSELYE